MLHVLWQTVDPQRSWCPYTGLSYPAQCLKDANSETNTVRIVSDVSSLPGSPSIHPYGMLCPCASRVAIIVHALTCAQAMGTLIELKVWSTFNLGCRSHILQELPNPHTHHSCMYLAPALPCPFPFSWMQLLSGRYLDLSLQLLLYLFPGSVDIWSSLPGSRIPRYHICTYKKGSSFGERAILNGDERQECAVPSSNCTFLTVRVPRISSTSLCFRVTHANALKCAAMRENQIVQHEPATTQDVQIMASF